MGQVTQGRPAPGTSTRIAAMVPVPVPMVSASDDPAHVITYSVHRSSSPQGAGERSITRVDHGGDLAALDHPAHPFVQRVGEPDAALGVERTAIRRVARHLGPHPPVGERAVVGDGEGGVAATEGLADDQRRAVRGDHAAVGELEPGGGLVHRAVRLHPHQARRYGLGAGLEVEAEVADVGGAVGRHHHVVAVPRGDSGQIGVLGDRAVGGHPEHTPIEHRHDEQRTVGHPTQARRTVLHRRDPLLDPVDQGEHPMPVEVGEPQTPVAPPRPLAEVEPGVDDGELAHGRSVATSARWAGSVVVGTRYTSSHPAASSRARAPATRSGPPAVTIEAIVSAASPPNTPR